MQAPNTSEAAIKRLKKRRGKEWRFQMWGRISVAFALAALAWLLVSIVGTGYTAFQQNFMEMDFELSESILAPDGTRDPEKLRGATNQIRQMVFKNPDLIGKTITITVPASDQIDQLLKGYIKRDTDESRRKVSNQQIAWADTLKERGIIKKKFNRILFMNPDSRDPELAGIASAAVGSLMILVVAFVLAFPIGVGAAIYLDEFAPKNKFTDFIVFGLLGLAVFLNFMGMPRSIPLVGGMVLALRVFPTITIATRSALQGVSPSIVDGALSLGASHTQAVFQQKLPLAGPGILTGSIIGMAQALGETAPLLMIGMVAFVTEVPNSVTEPATALPVQIFLWSDSAERAWAERTSAAIIILLVVLITMNSFAIWLRNRLEQRR
jgi:phosphate transport system permease protein